jgi:hypothetical protein
MLCGLFSFSLKILYTGFCLLSVFYVVKEKLETNEFIRSEVCLGQRGQIILELFCCPCGCRVLRGHMFTELSVGFAQNAETSLGLLYHLLLEPFKNSITIF